ncbi:hypothetical protein METBISCDRAFT_20928 [Metschnikowia bicuspidata]|uniref:Uncharacterized protein n=1 Tax=Metschnikowia bicuspidata TaxID=27322 RepID=A0A4V1J3S3_9ASCO|nr:hypothetical protein METBISCDRAFT_20928 [Metschnikowia bicuspidata]
MNEAVDKLQADVQGRGPEPLTKSLAESRFEAVPESKAPADSVSAADSVSPLPTPNPDQPESKSKQRKGQSEAEFLEQIAQYASRGPRINTENWLFDQNLIDSLDKTQKLDRVHMLHVCEKAYFDRDYEKCLLYVQQAERLFGVDADADDEEIKQNFSSAGRKTKKSSKVERHVVELIHIKEACLKKLGRGQLDE